MRDNLERTMITRGGLLALCQLRLTELSISKATSNIDGNSYGDDEALVIARHLPSLQELCAYSNKLGWEGVAAIASSLTKLETLDIDDNEEVSQGVTPLGRLPILKRLDACTCDSMQLTPKRRTGLQSHSPSS